MTPSRAGEMCSENMKPRPVDITCKWITALLKVIHHPLYSIIKFVTNKSKLPQDGAQVFPYMG